jgi:hypothetical protein
MIFTSDDHDIVDECHTERFMSSLILVTYGHSSGVSAR